MTGTFRRGAGFSYALMASRSARHGRRLHAKSTAVPTWKVTGIWSLNL